MAQGSSEQSCPVAMAAEILCTRWTVVLLRELVAGWLCKPCAQPRMKSQRVSCSERLAVTRARAEARALRNLWMSRCASVADRCVKF